MQNAPRADATYFFSSWWRGPMGVGPRLESDQARILRFGSVKRAIVRIVWLPPRSQTVRRTRIHITNLLD